MVPDTLTCMKIGRLGREGRPCGFCGETSWAGRGDLEGNFLCQPCVELGEKLLPEDPVFTSDKGEIPLRER